MKALTNHPGMYLRDDAADAFNAMEDKYGPIRVNRAGVSKAVQQELINRWDRGGPGNRPPALFEPKRPAEASEHVQYIAVDVYNYMDDRAKLTEFGFRWYGETDPVHYTFIGWDSPTGAKEEDDEMIVNIQGRSGVRSGGAYYIAGGVATFLGGTIAGLPTLTFDQGTALAKRVKGI